MENKNNLPSLNELYEDRLEVAFKNDQFNLLMNQPPKEAWTEVNKFANNSKYIPIGIVETLLQKIFRQYRIEILREGVMFNAVYCVVRLHYVHPVSGEWQFHDGCGAQQVQTKSGSSPADLQNINNGAVMMALPIAKSYAIKDACDHIGKLFGRDLNRKHTLDFKVEQKTDAEELRELYEIKKESLTVEEQQNAERIIKTNEVKSFKKLFDKLKSL